MFSLQLNEVYWENVEHVNENFGYLLNLSPGMFQGRAPLYAEKLHNEVTSLKRFLGFIDCTRIRMALPGGDDAAEQTFYSDHDGMHCFNYQIISALDGFILYHLGPPYTFKIYSSRSWSSGSTFFVHSLLPTLFWFSFTSRISWLQVCSSQSSQLVWPLNHTHTEACCEREHQELQRNNCSFFCMVLGVRHPYGQTEKKQKLVCFENVKFFSCVGIWNWFQYLHIFLDAFSSVSKYASVSCFYIWIHDAKVFQRNKAYYWPESKVRRAWIVLGVGDLLQISF